MSCLVVPVSEEHVLLFMGTIEIKVMSSYSTPY